jgi:hypothetical protein
MRASRPPTIPRAIARQRGSYCVLVACPYCGRQHQHGAGLGPRLAHCGGWRQYELVSTEGSSR